MLHDWNFPPKIFMKKIPNIIHTTTTTTATLAIEPTDSSRAVTTVFIATLCEINLRGLNVLNSLRIYSIIRIPYLNNWKIDIFKRSINNTS